MQRLLVIKPSSFGDIIHTLLVVQSLKEQKPEVQVDWVVRDIFAGLLEHSPLVHRLFYFHRGAGFQSFFKLLNKIRQERYDAVWDMQGLLRSGIMTLASRSPKKIGRQDAREGARWFYNETVSFPKGSPKPHAVEILIPFLKTLEAEVRLSERELPFDLTQKEINIDIGLKPGEYIVFFPDSRRPEKMWPYFKELTALLISRGLKVPIVWAGQGQLHSEEEWESSGFKNVMGKTKISQLIGLIRNAKLVIANDSGPMHLAAALKKPILALFGPTDAQSFGPYPLTNPYHSIIKAPSGHLNLLTIETVADHLNQLLNL